MQCKYCSMFLRLVCSRSTKISPLLRKILAFLEISWWRFHRICFSHEQRWRTVEGGEHIIHPGLAKVSSKGGPSSLLSSAEQAGPFSCQLGFPLEEKSFRASCCLSFKCFHEVAAQDRSQSLSSLGCDCALPGPAPHAAGQWLS